MGVGLGAGGVVARRGLFERLDAAPRVTVVSAPPGSGKTVLLRSWTKEAGLAERTAWVAAGRDERDPQRFWVSVIGSLRQTVPGSAMVQALAAAPDLDSWAVTERLLADLAPLRDRLWLGLRLVRRARVPGRGDPARPGGTGLGAGRSAARRSLARPVPGRAGCHLVRPGESRGCCGCEPSLSLDPQSISGS